MTPPTPLLMVSMPTNVEAVLMVPELFRVLRPPPKLAAGPAPSLAVHVPVLLKTSLPSVRLMRPSNVPALLMTIRPVVTGEEIARSLASPLVDRITPLALLLIVVVPVPLVAEMTGLATEPIPSTMLLMLMVLLPDEVLVAMALPPVAKTLLLLLMVMVLLPAAVLVAMAVPPVAKTLPLLMVMVLLPAAVLVAMAVPPVAEMLPPIVAMTLPLPVLVMLSAPPLPVLLTLPLPV